MNSGAGWKKTAHIFFVWMGKSGGGVEPLLYLCAVGEGGFLKEVFFFGVMFGFMYKGEKRGKWSAVGMECCAIRRGKEWSK